MNKIEITEIREEADLEKILPLIEGYQKFYGSQPDTAKNRKHFGRLLKNRDLGMQFAAWSPSGEPLGFATIYFTLSSVSAKTCCLLNDLFTVPAARKQGIGEALIHHALAIAAEMGFSGIEWQTQQENTSAHGLYDKIPGSEATRWLTYTAPCRM